jgi:hypothetical protein
MGLRDSRKRGEADACALTYAPSCLRHPAFTPTTRSGVRQVSSRWSAEALAQAEALAPGVSVPASCGAAAYGSTVQCWSGIPPGRNPGAAVA